MKKIVISLVVVFSLAFASQALAANTGAGQQGVHEPGTGIANPEVKEEGQGTGQGLTNQSESQTQSQTQNQGEDSQIQNQVQNQAQTETKSNASEMGVQRRSRVATAVQEMLQIADRNGGIGQQVREIAQAQNQEFEDAEASLTRAQERTGFVKFFIGPNYGKIYDAEKRMERVQERIQELIQLKTQLSNSGDQQLLQQHIQNLEQVKTELQNKLQEEQKGFSLFGWAFRLFAK
ncbi:MAG TPA: hypothetical protein P5096_01690 [Patescibacteria group bacterium]|nr:hypothetical protein [Patescibacteria group bacterium]